MSTKGLLVTSGSLTVKCHWFRSKVCLREGFVAARWIGCDGSKDYTEAVSMLGKVLGVGLVSFQFLCGCDLDERRETSKVTRSVEVTNVEPTSVAARRTPDDELLARPPDPPISIIGPEVRLSPSERPTWPVLEVHATGGGVLRWDGACLFLESDRDEVGLVFKNTSARFDGLSKELVVSGVRVRVGETMFVRASWWGGPSFEGIELTPPLAEACSRNHFWLVDGIGRGTPTPEDLNCDGEVDRDRAPRITMDSFTVRGGLEQNAEETFRQWRKNWGVLRVCTDKHLSRRIGTILEEELTVDVSADGRIAELAFQDDGHPEMIGCVKGYLVGKTPFSAAPQKSRLTLQLEISRGNSDYQITACDRWRRRD